MVDKFYHLPDNISSRNEFAFMFNRSPARENTKRCKVLQLNGEILSQTLKFILWRPNLSHDCLFDQWFKD